MNHSILDGNRAEGGGGAIFADGELSVVRSIVSFNQSSDGGGILFRDGEAKIHESTISDNRSGPGDFGSAGGIFLGDGDVDIANSTIARNTAVESGGGIYSYFARVSIRYSTIVGNEVTIATGGGIFAGDDLTLKGTIIAGNKAVYAPILPEICQDQGYNFIGVLDEGVDMDPLPDVLVGDPRLLPLGLYGGLTPTMPPAPGSPVIDAGGAPERPAATNGVFRASPASRRTSARWKAATRFPPSSSIPWPTRTTASPPVACRCGKPSRRSRQAESSRFPRDCRDRPSRSRLACGSMEGLSRSMRRPWRPR